MKRVLILLLMLIMICPSAMKAEGNTITIINCDKVNIRNEAGQSLGRVGCYTPVTVGETKGDSTYVTVSKAYLELYQEQYGLFEYINFYSGDISGWVKTRCLTEVDEDIDRIIYKAEEYRWEFWTDGIYHEIKSDDVVKNTCYEPHYSTLINFTPLTAHTRVRDLMNKKSTYLSTANGEWREAYYYFIMEEQFRSFGYNSLEDAYADNVYYLHDITGDGIPELIMDTCWNNDPPWVFAFFTYQPGKGFSYIGRINNYYAVFTILDNNKYLGMFCSKGRYGYYWTDYYYFNKNTQQIELERIEGNFDGENDAPLPTARQTTSDDDLYYAYKHSKGIILYPFARSEMPGLDEWNAFLKSYGY